MNSVHTVVQGEHLSSIAKQYGFSDYRTIWNHAQNAALQEERKNPHVLFPGDQVFIPDRALREETRSTDQRHRFVTKGQTLRLKVMLEDFYEKPIANAPCLLLMDDGSLAVTSDAAGKIQTDLEADAKHGTLTILDKQTPYRNVEITLKIGALDPVEKVSGQQARLDNLGYFAGEIGGKDIELLLSAIEEFQCDFGLHVDGVCGPATQAKLKQTHGC